MRGLTPPTRLVHLLALALPVLLAGCPPGPETTLKLQLHSDGSLTVASALLKTCDTLRQRLDRLGVSRATVEPDGADRITVRLPRKDDSERVRRILLAATVLELRLVRQPHGDGPLFSPDEVLARYDGKLPEDVEILPETVRDEEGKVTGERYYAVDRRAVLTGRDIESARPGLGQFGNPNILFTVKPEPARSLYEATESNVGALLAIVLDRRVVSAPRINARIGEAGVIEGGFTSEQAEDLAIVLGSGPLPGKLTLVEERVEGKV
jgi:preprotein translocase subunit SecD